MFLRNRRRLTEGWKNLLSCSWIGAEPSHFPSKALGVSPDLQLPGSFTPGPSGSSGAASGLSQAVDEWCPRSWTRRRDHVCWGHTRVRPRLWGGGVEGPYRWSDTQPAEAEDAADEEKGQGAEGPQQAPQQGP